MKKSFLVILLISIILPSCKKDQPTTPGELIIGKWSFLPTTYELYTNGSVSSTSMQYYTLTDYAEFKSNGTLQSQTNGDTNISQYKIAGDTLIFNNINKAKIKTLTTNNLSYYFTDTINATQYRVNTFNLKK